jgi:hypothetical protein
MGRKRINEEAMLTRLPAGWLKRMDAVLEKWEPRSFLVRVAIQREVERRERSQQRKTTARREARRETRATT